MKNKLYFLALSALSTLFIVICSSPFQAQTISAEKNATIGYNRTDESLNRQRVINSNNSKSKKVFAFSVAQIHAFEKDAFQLINKKRIAIGLDELKWDDTIATVARIHSENMAAKNFFSHSGSDGKMVDARADAVGLKGWRAIGENIAYNRGYEDPIECAVEKWLLSVNHRENLLNSRWKETGIGIAVTEDGTFYFTQVFLQRK